MKFTRTSLSIAAALLASTAFAQSSVTLSGVVALDITKGNGGTSPLYGSGGDKKATMNDVVSRLNIDGRKDFEKGFYAGFNLQTFFLADSGKNAYQTADTFFDGRALVKIGGAFGEVYAGREYSPVFYTAVMSDPWFWDTSNVQIGYLQFANYWNTSGVRTNNTIGYISPTVQGFTARLAHSLGEGEATGSSTGGSATYSQGPVWASLAFDGHTNENTVDKDKIIAVAAAYDFGFVRPMALYSSSKVAGSKYSAYSLAATMPLMSGAGTLKAAVSRVSDWDTATAGNQSLVKASVGYTHTIFKDTNLSLNMASAKGQLATRTTSFGVGISHSF